LPAARRLGASSQRDFTGTKNSRAARAACAATLVMAALPSCSWTAVGGVLASASMPWATAALLTGSGTGAATRRVAVAVSWVRAGGPGLSGGGGRAGVRWAAWVSPRGSVVEQTGVRAESGRAQQAGLALELAGHAGDDVAHGNRSAAAVRRGEGGGAGGRGDGGADHLQAGQGVQVHVGREGGLVGEGEAPQPAAFGGQGAGEADDEVEAPGEGGIDVLLRGCW
jgi:hypothetical protein